MRANASIEAAFVGGNAMSDQLLNVKEVAAWLGISVRAVWRWAADGVIPPPIVLGRLRRWSLRDLEEWAARAPRAISTVDWQERLKREEEQ
jgi:excisionase family DNA binding protein